MDKAALVGIDLEAGEQLIDLLEAHEFPISAAYWLFTPEWDEWRLVLASPIVDSLGSRNAYRRISDVLRKEPVPGINWLQIVATRTDDRIARYFKSLAVPGHPMRNFRTRKVGVNGQFIEDAFVYRA